MDTTLVEYIGFVVAALILGWAVAELNRRYFRQRRSDLEPLKTWVRLDSTRVDEIEEPLPDKDSDEDLEEVDEPDVHSRAQQNGHHSQSKKLL
jgi:hypothetical protein